MRLATIISALAFAPAAMAQPAEPRGLAGRSEAEVRAWLGAPDVARREDRAAMWTYRTSGCALYVYFRAAGREGLQATGASAGPRRRGEPSPGVEACLEAVRGQAPRNSGREGQRSPTGQTSHFGRRATQV